MAQKQPPLTDDQLAASLGFITTLSSHHMKLEQKQAEQQQQAQQPQPTQPVAPQQPDPASHEAVQDEEIQAIRAELESLRAEESKNGQETKNSGTAT